MACADRQWRTVLVADRSGAHSGLDAQRYAESVEEKQPEQPMRRPGPYRGKPELDVEFLNESEELIGTVAVELIVKIAASGLLVASKGPIDFHPAREVAIDSWQIWIGDECLRAKNSQSEPVRIFAGDTYRLKNIEIPVTVRPDIWFGPGSNDGDPPQPTPPLPQSGRKERVR